MRLRRTACDRNIPHDEHTTLDLPIFVLSCFRDVREPMTLCKRLAFRGRLHPLEDQPVQKRWCMYGVQ